MLCMININKNIGKVLEFLKLSFSSQVQYIWVHITIAKIDIFIYIFFYNIYAYNMSLARENIRFWKFIYMNEM